MSKMYEASPKYLYPNPIIQFTDSSNQNQQSLNLTSRQMELDQKIYVIQNKPINALCLNKIKNNQEKYLTIYEEFKEQSKWKEKLQIMEDNHLKQNSYINYFGKRESPIFSNNKINKSNFLKLSSQFPTASSMSQKKALNSQNLHHQCSQKKTKWITPNNKNEIMIQIMIGNNEKTKNHQQNKYKQPKKVDGQQLRNNNNQLCLFGESKGVQQHINNENTLLIQQLEHQTNYHQVHSRNQSCHTNSTDSPSPWSSNFYNGYDCRKAYSSYFKRKSKAKFYKQKLQKNPFIQSQNLKQNKNCITKNTRPKTCGINRKCDFVKDIMLNISNTKKDDKNILNQKNIQNKSKFKNSLMYFKSNSHNNFQNQRQSSNYAGKLFSQQFNSGFKRKNSKQTKNMVKQKEKGLQNILISTLSRLQQGEKCCLNEKKFQKNKNIKKKVFQQFHKDVEINKYINKKQHLQRSQKCWLDNQIQMDAQLLISEVKIDRINTSKGVQYARQVYLIESLQKPNS